MDSHSPKSAFVINNSHVGRMPQSASPIYDSGLGSLSSMERPKLIGGAAIHEEGDDESGVFSGDRYAETDCCVTMRPVQPQEIHTAPSKEFERMSISNSPPQREMMTTVRTDRPQVRQPTQKAKGSGRAGKVRRPHRNFSNVSMGARSSSPRLPSLPDNSGSNFSGGFSNPHGHTSLPQSWETSGYNSGLSSVDIFSGSSAVNAPWPSIDIFELQQNVQYFLPNRDGDTGFHLAVIHCENDLLDKLLFIMSRENRLRTVIDEQNNLYQTALHLATHMQQTEMIRKLLIAGAALDITDHKGNTPLHIAARFSSTKSLEEIIRYMSVQTILQVARIKNNEGLTCIHIAAKYGNMDTLRKFKSLGVDVDMQDLNSGKTALHSVVEKGSLSDVQFMLETCRAGINAVTYTGCTPLHIAAGRGDIALTAYLLSMGANPDLATDEGDTALDLAGSDQVRTLLTKAAALRWLY